ncbi:PREDICTED: polyubiquitin-B-like [Camelina sativa]|uniref:Polyubiquitin-B-like n=1 Tax=Camelina sativa TaxID=90675 RepID=A0ABM1QWP4_CAMSA|nr:PREDICTED: polyubiquitin-B-like [Camelina sativa]
MQISLTTVKGKNINLEVEDSSDIIDLKSHGPTRQLVLGLGPDPGPGAVMRIFVSTIKEKTFILEVKGSDTIKNVKTMIHDQGGPPVDQLNLNFHGTKLENRPTRQLVLGLGPDPGPGAVMRIFVSTIKEKTFILEVKGSDTIKNVKTMIHDQGGPPVDQLNLNFHGTKLENSRTIADYNIRPRANLVIMQSGCIC